MTPVLSAMPIPLRLYRLLDAYGPLLTSRQREACRLHFDEDWSFAEVAGQMGITRSGAYDLVRRAIAGVEEYEERLGLVAVVERLEQQIALLLNDPPEGPGPKGVLRDGRLGERAGAGNV